MLCVYRRISEQLYDAGSSFFKELGYRFLVNASFCYIFNCGDCIPGKFPSGCSYPEAAFKNITNEAAFKNITNEWRTIQKGYY